MTDNDTLFPAPDDMMSWMPAAEYNARAAGYRERHPGALFSERLRAVYAGFLAEEAAASHFVAEREAWREEMRRENPEWLAELEEAEAKHQHILEGNPTIARIERD